MKTASLRTATIAAAIVALGAFALFSIGGATAQQACIQPLSGNGTYNGTWDNTCLSENTPLGDYTFPTGTRYARFYTFTLSAPSTVTIELNSSADTYLYLMQGTGKAGTVLHYNDDVTRNEDPNSRISQSLSAGDYTIEATTYDVETTGSFTLRVSGLPDTTIPTATPILGAGETPTATSTPISGQATPTFMPTQTATPTITPTPAQQSASDNVLNRLTALETRVATQQELIATMESKITALDSRVAALESDVSTPMLTATETPVGTPVNAVTATPTPIPCTILAPGADLRNCDFEGRNFSGLNLTGADLSGSNLRGVDFTNAILAGVNMKDAEIDRDTDFEEADLSGADLSRMDLTNCKFEKADLEDAVLSDGTFERCDFKEAIFKDANLVDSKFVNSDFEGADFEGADLQDVEFEDSDLEGAVNMDRAENIRDVRWDDSKCPDGTESDADGSDTCIGHLVPRS